MNEYAKHGDPPVLSLTIYHSKGNNDNGHDLKGWYWWAGATDHPDCYYGEPEGPFATPEIALRMASKTYTNR